MKILALISVGLLGATTAFGADINQSMDAAADGTVLISNAAGSVEVRGWSRKQVEVSGELGKKVEELIFERDDDEVVIKVKVPRHRNGGTSSDLVVKVPQQSSIRVNTVSAEIDVADVEGEQELQSVSGDISTEARESDIKLGTVSGDIEVQGEGKPMRSSFSTVSGDIDTDSLAGEFNAETVNGDVVAINGSFERASFDAVNGSATFHAALTGSSRLDIESVNGAVDVEFDGDVSAKFDIETFNGSIRNCFGPESVRTSKYAPGRELRFTEGGGTGRVSIQTLNGRVRLCKK